MTTVTTPPPSSGTLPTVRRDSRPLLLVPGLALCMLPLIGSSSTWITLTAAGLAMGIIVFLMSSGLTLVFGLMNILNLGHGVFVALGAFVATSVLERLLASWMHDPSLLKNLGALVAAMLIALVIGAGVGLAFERTIIRPVTGRPLSVILTTMGGTIIGQELLRMLWGPDPLLLQPPDRLRGSFLVAGAVVETYRLTAAVFGLLVFVIMLWVLNRTKLGLLIRAAVENREMVESLGYRTRRLFLGVFLASTALAGLAGVMWGLYEQLVDAQLGGHTLVLSIIAIVMGGLGSVGGCFIGALLIGLLTNYAGFLLPKLTLVSDIVLMALILLWRPQGLYPVVRHE